MTDSPTQQAEEGVWDRLRRRKVVQWGVLYVAGAWGFLQGLEYISNSFHWPDPVRQTAILALAVGLPIVLVLAWYHGDRGEQRVGRAELTVIIILLLVGGAILWRYALVMELPADVRAATTQQTSPSTARPEASRVLDEKSIAVLPFVNMSSDKEQEYFADGMSEELLNLLAKVPDLRVIARTSSFSFKGKDVDIAEIARRLNVANVLEGSVRRSGDKLRITAQLIRASDSSHLWSETYNREFADVFAIQDEIAGQVVDALKVELLGRAVPKEKLQQNAEAYSLVLQARYHAERRTPEGYRRALDFYQQALSLAPDYALAWAELGRVKTRQAQAGTGPGAALLAEARAAAHKALELDPDLAEAHGALGSIYLTFDWDWNTADAAFQRALRLAPNDARMIANSAMLDRTLGRYDQAIARLEDALRRDPLSARLHATLAIALERAGRFDAAADSYRRALELNPEGSMYHSQIGLLHLLRGDAAAALAEMEREPEGSWRPFVLALAYHTLGQRTESDAALTQLVGEYSGESAFQIAEVHAWRGEVDETFAWLDRAYEQRDGGLSEIKGAPLLKGLESDPRYRELLTRLKLPN